MTFFGDCPDEMPRSRPFDDDAIDAILSGANPQGVADMAAFVSDVRVAGDVVPAPSAALAAALATGLSTDKGVPRRSRPAMFTGPRGGHPDYRSGGR